MQVSIRDIHTFKWWMHVPCMTWCIIVTLCCPSCLSGMKVGALDFTLLCSSFSNGGCQWILPDVGMVKYVSNVPWSWWMLTMVARMSWYTSPCSYTFSTGCFFPCSYLIGGTIPTSVLVLVSIFTPLVFVLFMECQLHIMKIKSLILGTQEPHAYKLLLQAYTKMAVSDRPHSHAYSTCSACIFKCPFWTQNGCTFTSFA